jgi:phosphoribosylcarboxyaminoimidazole (NCAIR) mutase
LNIRGRLDKKRKIAFMFGSDNDLKQCVMGLEYLEAHQRSRQYSDITILGVYTNSIHRNMFRVLFNVFMLWVRRVDVIIVCAGWAAHLPGMVEAFLRYVLRTTRVSVVPVAIDADPTKPEDEEVKRRNLAAIYSISEVPKHQMVLYLDREVWFGARGFLGACRFSCENLFKEIKLPPRVPWFKRTLIEALEKARNLEKGVK